MSDLWDYCPVEMPEHVVSCSELVSVNQMFIEPYGHVIMIRSTQEPPSLCFPTVWPCRNLTSSFQLVLSTIRKGIGSI